MQNDETNTPDKVLTKSESKKLVTGVLIIGLVLAVMNYVFNDAYRSQACSGMGAFLCIFLLPIQLVLNIIGFVIGLKAISHPKIKNLGTIFFSVYLIHSGLAIMTQSINFFQNFIIFILLSALLYYVFFSAFLYLITKNKISSGKILVISIVFISSPFALLYTKAIISYTSLKIKDAQINRVEDILLNSGTKFYTLESGSAELKITQDKPVAFSMRQSDNYQIPRDYIVQQSQYVPSVIKESCYDLIERHIIEKAYLVRSESCKKFGKTIFGENIYKYSDIYYLIRDDVLIMIYDIKLPENSPLTIEDVLKVFNAKRELYEGYLQSYDIDKIELCSRKTEKCDGIGLFN